MPVTRIEEPPPPDDPIYGGTWLVFERPGEGPADRGPEDEGSGEVGAGSEQPFEEEE